jgi:Fur family transcriptional regulator, ferric uptake regulator
MKREILIPDELTVLSAYLKSHGGKMTAPRATVLEAFLSLERHVTAEQVFEVARKTDPGIGQATVFRTMRLLAEAGLAREARTAAGSMEYEHAYRHAHHDHLICVDCGKVVEFEDEGIEKAQEAVYRSLGFEPTWHRMELLGRCPACAKSVRAAKNIPVHGKRA